MRPGEEFRLPAFVFPNQFYIGDNVLLEPIARLSAIHDRSYVLTNHSELFDGHPIITGVQSVEELPEECSILDLTEEISSIVDSPEGKMIAPDKNLRMWKAAGFPRVMDFPRLYLTQTEWTQLQDVKRLFHRPCIGVILRSNTKTKDWAYTVLAIRALIKKKHYNVFVFGKYVPNTLLRVLPPGTHFVLDMPLRKVMQTLAMMDMLISPDTGLAHIGAALGRPLVVICWSIFNDLYEMYPNATILTSDDFTFRKGITGISVRTVLKEVDKQLFSGQRTPVALKVSKSEPLERHLVIRFKGIGDGCLTFPGLATARSQNGNSILTYMTSPPIAALLRQTGLVDEIIEFDFNHSAGGLPLPPAGYDYTKYDSIANMMNRVDYGPETADIPRVELFARELGLEKVDFNTSWKFRIPPGWIQDARAILEQHGIGADDKVIILQTDSKGLSRRWPLKRQKEFAGIARQHGYRIVLVSDVKTGKFPEWVVNLTGKLPFTTYAGMIAAGTILVCPDSGGLHIAGCSDNLALGLFGSVDPKLRIDHYHTVHAIVGKARLKGRNCVPCNDWQLASCQDASDKWPKCMWSIRADKVFQEVRRLVADFPPYRASLFGAEHNDQVRESISE